MTASDKALNKVLGLLNDALQRDPEAVSALLELRTPCNVPLADSKWIVVVENPTATALYDTKFMIGPLGLINGILDCLLRKKIAAVYDTRNPKQVIRFAKYNSGLRPKGTAR